jgi:hypothetical protein
MQQTHRVGPTSRAPTDALAWAACALLLATAGCSCAPVAASPDAFHYVDASVAADRAVDVGVDAPTCGPTTSLADFDAFVDAYVEGSLRQPNTERNRWAYARARVAMGGVSLDPSLADRCVSVAGINPNAGLIYLSAHACDRALRPRCPAPLGTPCGASFDCDADLVCVGADPSCQREGRCEMPIPLGASCEVLGVPCAAPSPGLDFAGCYPTADGSGPHRCFDVVFVDALVGERYDQYRQRPDGTTVELSRCPPDLVEEHPTGLCVVPPLETGSRDGPCDMSHRCAEGLLCLQHCVLLADLGSELGSCTPGDPSITNPCGFFESLACVGTACVPIDGLRGSPCDHSTLTVDCAAGLTCGPDLRCGDPHPLAEACWWDDTGCESGCCSRRLPFADSACIPFGS